MKTQIKIKILINSLLIAAIVFSFAGCGSKRVFIGQLKTNMNKLDNYDQELKPSDQDVEVSWSDSGDKAYVTFKKLKAGDDKMLLDGCRELEMDAETPGSKEKWKPTLGANCETKDDHLSLKGTAEFSGTKLSIRLLTNKDVWGYEWKFEGIEAK